MLGPINYPVLNDSCEQVRYIKKHYNPKFRKERGQKFIKIELPDLEENNDDLSEDVVRTKFKKFGIYPQRNWNERPVFVNCTSQIFESYVVPEGDGKFSPITTMGAKQKLEYLGKKSKSVMALRKIKTYEDDFKTKEFVDKTLDIYKKAHEALTTKDEDQILQYVTEYAYPLMIHNMMDKTIVWKFVQSLEPARIVHARVASAAVKDNYFAQVTVRFHTQQFLCIYDRFGRLLLGSETVKKDVLDYIVFEKYLSNTYGIWRVHGKIIPNWLTPAEVASKTYVLPAEEKNSLPSKSDVESVAQTVPLETLDKKVTESKI
ncbi:putative 39S ribosomal protein L45, mitochondrial [Habropoda laboriosa]|uniref:Large ribosomal subunit protein mL45 n=2 Tax=Habropoda laboriosa TaxID=597456 RepID=A0A0L7R2M4_9HYME|nr:putative 39S ribosomal protein L45, mitochondrial [Habropoda laboriosa]